MNLVATYNRVLLTEIGFMRPVRVKGAPGLVRDGSALAYQIEELIALGTMEIAIKDCPMNKAFRDNLSTKLRNRVRLIDGKQKCLSRVKALLTPMAEELCLELQDYSVDIKKKLDEDTQWAATHLYFHLQNFLLGVEYRLQIDIDIANMKSSVDHLRRALRSPESRAVASILAGILCTYQPISLFTAVVRPTAKQQLISLFEEFVQDETYRHLSEESHRIGIPQRVKRAVTMLRRHAKKLISKPAFREVTDLSSKAITAATQVPVPGADAYNSLVPSGYLPPVVSLRKVSENARAVWLAQKPDIVFPPFNPDYWNNEDVIDDIEDEDETTQRIRIDRVRGANHDLSRLLNKPGPQG